MNSLTVNSPYIGEDSEFSVINSSTNSCKNERSVHKFEDTFYTYMTNICNIIFTWNSGGCCIRRSLSFWFINGGRTLKNVYNKSRPSPVTHETVNIGVILSDENELAAVKASSSQHTLKQVWKVALKIHF